MRKFNRNFVFSVVVVFMATLVAMTSHSAFAQASATIPAKPTFILPAAPFGNNSTSGRTVHAVDVNLDGNADVLVLNEHIPRLQRRAVLR